MSWNAQRFKPGKPVLRAIRHRKKVLSAAEEDALRRQPATEGEVATALMYASDHQLDRWMAIISLANQVTVYERYNKHITKRASELEAECESWKFKWLLERSKVKSLETLVGTLRQRRQRARTRMRAGKHVTRFVPQ